MSEKAQPKPRALNAEELDSLLKRYCKDIGNMPNSDQFRLCVDTWKAQYFPGVGPDYFAPFSSMPAPKKSGRVAGN